MSNLVLKETLSLLKQRYTVFVPYFGTPYALYKSNFYKSNFYSIKHPIYTYNNDFSFISSSSIDTWQQLKYYNKIASEIRERDMFGNVIIYPNDKYFE